MFLAQMRGIKSGRQLQQCSRNEYAQTRQETLVRAHTHVHTVGGVIVLQSSSLALHATLRLAVKRKKNNNILVTA